MDPQPRGPDWMPITPYQHHLVPDERFLDVARLSGLAVPPLKEISGFIAGKFSGQQIANSLRKFGIRHPQARGT